MAYWHGKPLKRKNRSFFRPRFSKNPFFSSSSEDIKAKVLSWLSFSNWKSRLIIFASIAVVLVLVFWLYFSPFFKLKEVVVKGLVRVPENDIIGLAWKQVGIKRLFLSQDNIFLFDSDSFRNKLINDYLFKEVEIEKNLPNTIVVKIKEREGAILWQEEGKSYLLDDKGYVAGEMESGSIKKGEQLLLVNEGSSRIKEKKVNLDNSLLVFALDLYGRLASGTYGLTVDYFAFDKAGFIKVKIVNGPWVYFGEKESIEKQLNKLTIIKGEKLKDDFVKQVYIDLRYDNRIYYR